MGFGVLFGGNDIVFERLRFEAEMRLHRFVHLPPEFRLADLEQVPEVIMVLDELRDALRHSGIIERAQSPRAENAVDRVGLPACPQITPLCPAVLRWISAGPAWEEVAC